VIFPEFFSQDMNMRYIIIIITLIIKPETEHYRRVITSASFLRGPGFKARTGDWPS
jgi:hypothetical protein